MKEKNPDINTLIISNTVTLYQIIFILLLRNI